MRFAPAAVDVSYRADGSVVARSPLALPAPPRCLSVKLQQWAAAAPERPFLAERADRATPGAAGWRVVTWGEALLVVERLGQALLEHGLSAERPLVILSDNGVDHALLSLAAMHVGVPVAPLSPAYSLQSRDFGKLRAIAAQLTPGLVFAEDGAAFGRAFAALGLPAQAWVAGRNAPPGATSLAQLLPTSPGATMRAARDAVGPDTVAKILFTSGSTGQPKGVINTQRMLTANQEMLACGWPLLRERPPVVVDWLPWSHTFGGNHNFNLLLWHGGTLYVDDGKPTPACIGRTLEALADVAPTLYFNVPRGYDVLLPHLERDPDLCARFLSQLDLLFYAAAALPEPLWRRLTTLVAAHGRDVPFVSAWGSTETSPLATQVHYPLDGAGNIGLPPPGVELKLAPVGGKLELRVRGPHVTPGYWRAPELSRSAFDDEGYYQTGDAGRWYDPADPRRGLVFDGRLAEDFKLTSGSWVRVGALRLGVLGAAAPLVQDAVIAGHDRDYVALVLFVDGDACARAGDWRAALIEKLAEYNRAVAQPSLSVRRAIVAVEPPSIDAGEITDKGYLNQRAILARRAELVARLYGDAGVDGDDNNRVDVIVIE
jgi:feruloyl-CoA synthase